MEIKDYKGYLDIFFSYKIEGGIPDDEVCVSIDEIYEYCKRSRDV